MKEATKPLPGCTVPKYGPLFPFRQARKHPGVRAPYFGTVTTQIDQTQAPPHRVPVAVRNSGDILASFRFPRCPRYLNTFILVHGERQVMRAKLPLCEVKFRAKSTGTVRFSAKGGACSEPDGDANYDRGVPSLLSPSWRSIR